MPEIKPAALEAMINLVVHDLRNPAATLGANLSFVDEVLDDETVDKAEVRDALADAQQALHDLKNGLDQLSWIGRWFNERAPIGTAIESLRSTLERVEARHKYGTLVVEKPLLDRRVRGGDALERLVELLIANGLQHAPRAPVTLRTLQEGAELLVEIEDRGRPIPPELSEVAFTLEGQTALKGRAEGRYGRVLGLFSAAILAQALGVQLSVIERESRNVFRIALRAA
ncbi:MAG: Chemotaxis protein methyltransferase CheR [Myxococcaceae bacterium]|nr:Chemotaxis protein methyltransferase CheR [Myxococcaceae bacterium]